MGCFGWGQKVYVENVSVLFRSPILESANSALVIWVLSRSISRLQKHVSVAQCRKAPQREDALDREEKSAVELKTGPIFAFSSVKNWSILFFCFGNLILPAERRGFFKKKEEKKQKKQLLLSKCPIFVHFSFLGFLQFPMFSEMFFDR